MTGNAASRWRCRKNVHHFVMLHSYRSSRGRVAARPGSRRGAVAGWGSGSALFPRVCRGGGSASWPGSAGQRVLIYRASGDQASAARRGRGVASVSAWVSMCACSIERQPSRGSLAGGWSPLGARLASTYSGESRVSRSWRSASRATYAYLLSFSSRIYTWGAVASHV